MSYKTGQKRASDTGQLSIYDGFGDVSERFRRSDLLSKKFCIKERLAEDGNDFSVVRLLAMFSKSQSETKETFKITALHRVFSWIDIDADPFGNRTDYSSKMTFFSKGGDAMGRGRAIEARRIRRKYREKAGTSKKLEEGHVSVSPSGPCISWHLQPACGFPALFLYKL